MMLLPSFARSCSRSRIRVVGPSVLAALVEVSVVHARFEPNEPGQPDYGVYERTLDEADRARREGHLGLAVETYTVAYESLPPTDRVTSLGSDIVEHVAMFVQSDYDGGHRDPKLLSQAIALIELHLADIARSGTTRDTTVYEELNDRLTAELHAIEAERQSSVIEAEPEPFAIPEVETANDGARSTMSEVSPIVSPPSPAEDRVAWGDRRSSSLGFTIGGAAGIALGVGLVVYGQWLDDFALSQRRQTCTGVIPSQYDACEAERDDYFDGLNAGSVGSQATGAVVGAVGIGLLTTGIVFLVRQKRRASIAIQPSFRRLSLTVAGRF